MSWYLNSTFDLCGMQPFLSSSFVNKIIKLRKKEKDGDGGRGGEFSDVCAHEQKVEVGTERRQREGERGEAEERVCGGIMHLGALGVRVCV